MTWASSHPRTPTHPTDKHPQQERSLQRPNARNMKGIPHQFLLAISALRESCW